MTALVWDGSEGGSPGHGIDDTFRAGEAGITFTVTGTSAGVSVHLHSSDALRRLGYAEVRLFPASGTRLTPGTYDDAVPAYFGPAPTAGMWVASDNAGCDMTGGRFVIHEAVYEANTDGLRSLAATFEIGCSSKLIFGEIRYNSTVTWVSRHGAGVVVPFMTPAVGQPVERTVRITSDGSSALRTGAVRLEGTAAGFSVVRDGCSNQTLVTGAGCDVTVRYAASDPTARSATLVVPDNSARGARRWTLEGAVSSSPPPPNAPDPAAPSAAPTSALFLDRSDWWPDQYRFVQTIRDGDPYVSFSVTGTAYGVHVSLTSSDPDVYGPGPFPIDLRLFPAADGDTLSSGRSYIGATRWPFHEGAEPGMDLDVRSTGCNQAAGSFTIFDLGFDGNGQISRLAAAWRFGCVPTDRLEVGEVRWKSTVPLASRSVAPDAPGLGYYLTEQDALTSQTVTITSQGSGPLVIGTVEMSGDTDAFPVRSERCSGMSLPPGATCTVTIDYTPTAVGASYATLVIPDNTAAGGVVLPLFGQDYRQPVGNPAQMPPGGGGQL
ncbi:MAG TPA: choice-of-anchor D domain-containing protein, partial [Acidimicrobiia bacterium]|nr:choice-of-anchor D domain-containing protein [Acidimicrobiia bacterium]